MGFKTGYYIHQFKDVKGFNGEERSVVMLGEKDVEHWVAAIELKDEAKERLTKDDKAAIADFINALILKRREQQQKNELIVVPQFKIFKPEDLKKQ